MTIVIGMLVLLTMIDRSNRGRGMGVEDYNGSGWLWAKKGEGGRGKGVMM